MTLLFGREWTRDELLRRVGHADQLAGVKLLEGADGVERGARVLRVWTGSGLEFDVLAERCLDLAACRYRGIPLAWLSPAGAAHPAYYEPAGAGWLRTFPGGLLATCGLDQFGAPSDHAGEHYGLHGRIANTPAQALAHRAYWDGDVYRLEIAGEMRQARLFGENLLLRRSICAELGASRIRIEDVVTNQGFQAQPHMLLYHFNLGFPLVGERARLVLDAERTVPRDVDAELGAAEWDRFQPPTPGYREQVFYHAPRPGADGRVHAEMRNPELGLGLRLSYAAAELPHLYQWKMMGEGAYVVGVEPANCAGILGRADAVERGVAPILQPGESRRYAIEIEVLEY